MNTLSSSGAVCFVLYGVIGIRILACSLTFFVSFFFFKPSIGSLKMMIDELFNLGNSWPWVNLRANLETSYSKDKTKQNKLKNLCDIEELLS